MNLNLMILKGLITWLDASKFTFLSRRDVEIIVPDFRTKNLELRIPVKYHRWHSFESASGICAA